MNGEPQEITSELENEMYQADIDLQTMIDKANMGHEWICIQDNIFPTIYKCINCKIYKRSHGCWWNIAFSKKGTNIFEIKSDADCDYIAEHGSELMKQIKFKELLK